MFCENITISWEPWSPCCWYSSISCRRDNWCFHSRTEIFKKLSTLSYIARSIYRIFSERRKRLFIDAFLAELCLKLVQRPMHWELCFQEGHVTLRECFAKIDEWKNVSKQRLPLNKYFIGYRFISSHFMKGGVLFVQAHHHSRAW